ncbi:MAG: Tex family protein [Fusobacteriota bacterium]
MNEIVKEIAKKLDLKPVQVKNTIELLDDGSTVPFIARYRKEQTKSLDEQQIQNILDEITYIRNLEERKKAVINLIDEQGELTDELKVKIEKAKQLQKVEDLYLPYKKRKKTLADKAVDKGLQPLADYMKKEDVTKKDLEKEAGNYLTDEVKTVEDAIEEAKLIIAQDISQEIKYREYIRGKMKKNGTIISEVVEKNKKEDEKQTYKDYYNFQEKVKHIASHRVLALNRGEKEKILRVKIELSSLNLELITKAILKDYPNKNLEFLYRSIIEDSLDRLILPSIEREVRNILTEMAEEEAIASFQENLKNLLMQPPMEGKNILGLDPAYRTGCKVVVIDNLGTYKENDVIFVTMSESKKKEAKDKLKKYIKKHDINLVAIGNGTASRETESFVAEMLKEVDKKVQYIIVNEAGASVYSASKLAREEFPDLDVTVRGAISIARRVQDPLAELVKIDPKSIGVGMYQHDITKKRLEKSLTQVVESAVNNVGVNINSASWALLNYVSGLRKNACKKIVQRREKEGKFTSRKDLSKVKGIGKKTFKLAAGFIMVPESDNPLDNTIIHPESYDIAEEMLEKIDVTLDDLRDDIKNVKEKLKLLDVDKFIEENDYGEETVVDIYNSLLQKRRDPRDEYTTPILKEGIVKLEDLKPGMELEGTVRNVVQFGAFVDIGLKNDALLHISEIGKKFVKDPNEELSVGDIIKVKIKDIDAKRDRVGLTKKGL